jgi:hydroxyethylthiazole kinase-like uncharacterized protein yjeF
MDVNALTLRLHRGPEEHKGHAGKAVLVGGEVGMAGALLLAGQSCLYLGAGWTILQMLDQHSATVHSNYPELMISQGSIKQAHHLQDLQADALGIGPGLGQSHLAEDYLQRILSLPEVPIVIDADALNLIARSQNHLSQLRTRNQRFPNQTVLTPHPGEAARLLKIDVTTVQQDRLKAIHQLVELTESIVVLKGKDTLIASPDHAVEVCQAGNPGMATGGMGDILTGGIVAIAAQGVHHHLDLWESSCIAVQIHALAADQLVKKGVGPIGLTPSETILEMRSIINQCLKNHYSSD